MKRKRLIRISALVVLVFVMVYCVSANKVNGSGTVEKEMRKVEAFSMIESNGSFDIYLSQSAKEGVVVEADDNLLTYIKTEVSNNTLKIYTPKGIKISKSSKINIYISITNLSKVSMNGVGDLSCLTDLNLVNLKLTNSGVGDINLKGTAESLDVRNTGVGDIDVYQFVVENLSLTNTGVGDVKVKATSEITIKNSGVGDVVYSGGANMTDIQSSGVGSVRKSNN